MINTTTEILVCTRCWYTTEDIMKDYPEGTPRFGPTINATVTYSDGIMYTVPHRADCKMLRRE